MPSVHRSYQFVVPPVTPEARKYIVRALTFGMLCGGLVITVPPGFEANWLLLTPGELPVEVTGR